MDLEDIQIGDVVEWMEVGSAPHGTAMIVWIHCGGDVYYEFGAFDATDDIVFGDEIVRINGRDFNYQSWRQRKLSGR